jgi:hypothetical protein
LAKAGLFPIPDFTAWRFYCFCDSRFAQIGFFLLLVLRFCRFGEFTVLRKQAFATLGLAGRAFFQFLVLRLWRFRRFCGFTVLRKQAFAAPGVAKAGLFPISDFTALAVLLLLRIHAFAEIGFCQSRFC